MQFQQLQPPEYLKHHVQFFWKLESNVHDSLPKTFGPLADGCPGIFFYQSSEGRFYDHAERKVLPGVFLYGQTIKPREITTPGKFEALGVTLFPHALQTVFGMHAAQLTDTCANLDDVYKRDGSGLREQLVNTATTEARIALMSSYLFSQINLRASSIDQTLQYAVARMLRSNGSLTITKLQEELKVSERSLERRFKESVGITPKMFLRVCRFQSSLQQLHKQGYEKLSDIAFANGYADQSHFIRTFKEFVGHAPNQYRKVSNAVMLSFPELKKQG